MKNLTILSLLRCNIILCVYAEIPLERIREKFSHSSQTVRDCAFFSCAR